MTSIGPAVGSASDPAGVERSLRSETIGLDVGGTKVLGVVADASGALLDEHRVLTSDIKFLADEERERLLDVERRVVAEFADALCRVRPELREAHLHKPLTMLLFGMINWTFTWLRPDGELTHEALATLVTDLFFGGLGAVQLRQPALIP